MDAFSLFGCIVITLVVTSSGITLKRASDHQFSREDIAQLFGADNLNDVPDYQFINLDQLIKHQKDGRRGALCIKAFDKNLCVKFIPNKKLGGRTHTVEYHHANGTVKKFTNVLRDYNLGTVNDERSSHAAFYHCGRGLTGHIKVANDLYIVNPLTPRLKSHKSNHVIYRRKRRDTTLQMLETDIDGLKMMEDGIEDALKKRGEKSTTSTTSKSTTSEPEKTMELMIAADYRMVDFYKDALNGYIVAMANLIYGFFQDPSLAYPMTVALVKTVFFKENNFNATTMSDLHSKFTLWCRTNNPADDEDPEHWDNAILITRNGCGDGCAYEGLGKISMCTLDSTSVCKDRGLMTAMTAVHEIGHNLYVPHDGDNNICPDGLNFMATGATGGKHQEEWSSCASYVLDKAMRLPGSSCYNDKPADKARIQFRLYGTEYNASRQCQFIYGHQFIGCIHTTHRCDRLLCTTPDRMNVCQGISYPPIDGTRCGPHEWCIHDFCVPDGSTPAPPVNGGWSAWGDYTKCTKICGIGDQWRERKCNSPEPMYGGLNCKGETKRSDFRTCNTQKCPGLAHPTALEQCHKFNKDYNDHYIDGRNRCLLNCGNKGSPYYIVSGWKLDGTKCGHSETFPEICINNICETLGCDLVLGSGAVPDRCGVCDGDGNTCKFYSGNDTKPYNNYYGHHLLTTIPAGSMNITVKEMHPTWLGFLGFKVGDAAKYAIHLPWLYNGAQYNLDGTIIKFWSQHYTAADKIQATGKIDKPISIYYYSYFGPRSTNRGITWNYLGPVTGTPDKTTFKWLANEWSECSHICAGGTQNRKVVCLRDDDKSQVSKISCSSSKTPPSVQACNAQDCEPDWHVTEWSECSKSCGKGVMTRAILCSVKTKTKRKTVYDLKLCIEEKPKDKISKDCHAKMCPAEWHIVSEYDECSTSCGGGVKTRSVVCKHVCADGVLRQTHPSECIKHQKPADKKTCQEEACPTDEE